MTLFKATLQLQQHIKTNFLFNLRILFPQKFEGLRVHYCIKSITGEKVNCLNGWDESQSNGISRVLGTPLGEREKKYGAFKAWFRLNPYSEESNS